MSVLGQDPPPPPGPEPEQPAKPVRASWHALGIPALAVVAALVIWLRMPMPGRLPNYALEIAGAGAAQSAAGAATPTHVELEPGRGLTLLFRPSSVPSVPIEALAFVALGAASDGAAKPVPSRSEAAGPGVLRLSVSSESLPAAGRLIVLVGRVGALPTSSSTGSAWHGNGWQRFEIAFTRPDAPR